MYAPLLGLVAIIKIVWNRLISKESKNKKMQDIEKELNDNNYRK